MVTNNQLFGLADDFFEQRKPIAGLITKREVRAVSLARLSLTPTSIVWDIGAGSGAVAIEAARLCQAGIVFAVEKNHADLENCRANLEKAGCTNLMLIEGFAPDACQNWAEPDAVFIGGNGGQLAGIVELVAAKLKPEGKVVANMATLENLNECLQLLQAHNFETDVTLVQVSRSRDLQGLTRLEALNPVFVIAAQPKEATND